MYQSYIMMQYIDELRKNQKIKVADLNEGITTVRTYSRYVSGEFDIGVDVLLAYLKRLNFTLPDFWLYIYNSLHFDNADQLELIRLIQANKINAAKELAKKVDLNRPSEIFDIFLPVSMLKLKYLQKKILKSEFLDGINQLIDLPRLLKSDVISRQEFNSLLIYYEFAQSREKKKILKFFEKIIEEKKEIISLKYREDRMIILDLLITEALKCQEMDAACALKVSGLFERLISDLNMQSHERIGQKSLENLVTYYERINDKEKREIALFHLISHKLITYPLEELDLSEEEYNTYLKVLDSGELFKQSFFGKLRYER